MTESWGSRSHDGVWESLMTESAGSHDGLMTESAGSRDGICGVS